MHGDSLYVGLRGPVLRGWACVLEVLPVADQRDPARLRIGAFGDETRYRKHLLDLGGLGVRDLCPDGEDLLVLAGPSMALSGPVRLHRWHRAANAETSRVVRGAELTLETVLPYGAGDDHAEGIALLAEAATPASWWSTTAPHGSGGPRPGTRQSPDERVLSCGDTRSR